MSVLIDYTNYRGERAIRHIELPASPTIDLNGPRRTYHPNEHVICAYDLDKDRAWREFTMSGIHAWRTVQPGEDVAEIRLRMRREP